MQCETFGRTYGQQMVAQYGGQALGALLQKKSATTRTLAQQVYGLGANYGVMLPYSRSNESEADRMELIFAAMQVIIPRLLLSSGKECLKVEHLFPHSLVLPPF